jgi:formylglycine-generating enzyme required for sulfatase activity
MGSPETEFHRGIYTERLTAVTLTHTFEIEQHEITRQQWSDLVNVIPEKPDRVQDSLATCTDSDCPVRYVKWFEALQFANLYSERHDPPLEPCYVLSGCQEEIGKGMTCTAVSQRAPTVYECEGYRLPTEAEWEYAARAGTRTAYYSGDITQPDYIGPDPNLDPIAWYQANSDNRTHRVNEKRPNRWMLFDMLGNVDEWTSDQPVFNDPPGPFLDPATEIELTTKYAQDMRVTKGGQAGRGPYALRVAGWDYPPSDSVSAGVGFRLARTLK